MTESVVTVEMTDEQYEAEADRLLTEIRRMREESLMLGESIEVHRANSQQTMQEIGEILHQMKGDDETAQREMARKDQEILVLRRQHQLDQIEKRLPASNS